MSSTAGARITSDPPLIVPIEELARRHRRGRRGEGVAARCSATTGGPWHPSAATCSSSSSSTHFARKVVGVGSVGTRAWIALLLGRDGGDPLFLQLKEAGPSVLEPFLGRSEYDNCGQRVVAGQRLMQAASDIFLGWKRIARGLDGRQRDFYVRQLHDWKGSADVERMRPKGMAAYGRMCGWTLARAHARSGDRIAIASYLGRSDTFDQAIVAFSEAYADQNERDYDALVEAVQAGRITAETGL